jgi:hypothetical protein
VPALINFLLTAPDALEVVRDKIASILKLETEKQAELGLPPLDVPRVFLERSNPWEMLADSERPDTERPIVNVWFDSETFDGIASNTVERQKADATFNIDVYAVAVSSQTEAGHVAGDLAAVLACGRALRLVRQILMSAHYTYLDLRGLVWRRWPQSLGMMQPPIDARTQNHLAVGRLVLAVGFNEVSPQVASETLESVHVEVFRAESGELYLSAQYPGEIAP